uniref:AB hydrolase-1 domain-containing protein n=1 Tax=Kalanchoe fedtschenkoi TaxID=63787 RepID=A0A7N0VDZ8_KALFE
MSGKSWQEELASLVEDTGIVYTVEVDGEMVPMKLVERERELLAAGEDGGSVEEESLKEQVEGFVKAWGELVVEFGKGCVDILRQNLLTDECYVVHKLRKPWARVSGKLRFLNEFLPEDRDPAHAWPVVFFVLLLALSVLNVNMVRDDSAPLVKRVLIHPPSASRVLLPDGRYLAYLERGVPVKQARYSVISPHAFLSSRLAGVPGIKDSLLQEFGIHLLTYDLPGFGESDPHPRRNLNSSALDMLYLASAVGIVDKFWVLSYSSGSIHGWAALKYSPDRIAGAVFLAPFVNPYDSSMTREERSQTWGQWISRRRLMYVLARRSPKLLSYFYRRTFLSGKHGPISRWLSFSPGSKDQELINKPMFEQFWCRDVEESIRQGKAKPFIEEAALQVSDWGFKLSDLQLQRKCRGGGFLQWLKSIYQPSECELTGFLGPIHIWQGTDDRMVPISTLSYLSRVLPGATLHKLPDEGHFSYYYLCHECHRQIFSTLFGEPRGALHSQETQEDMLEGESSESLPASASS